MEPGADATLISVATLEELMAVYFPDRVAGNPHDVDVLAREFHATGCSSIEELRALLDRNRERLVT